MLLRTRLLKFENVFDRRKAKGERRKAKGEKGKVEREKVKGEKGKRKECSQYYESMIR